jgi:CheY-like chemotaxis protein
MVFDEDDPVFRFHGLANPPRVGRQKSQNRVFTLFPPQAADFTMIVLEEIQFLEQPSSRRTKTRSWRKEILLEDNHPWQAGRANERPFDPGRMKSMSFQTLIVEDSADYRHLLRDALCGHFPAMDVQEAENGREADERIRLKAPDLIFMDINLPGENGLELTKKIKAGYPGIVIVILTNYDQPEYRDMAVRCRADFFLSKGSATQEHILALVETLVPT